MRKAKKNKAAYNSIKARIRALLGDIAVLLALALLVYVISNVKPAITHTGPYGNPNNPIAFGNWYTTAGLNYYGPGYYSLPNGNTYYASSPAQLVSSAKSNNLRS